jgi:uncharacterized protein (DUF488 family)
MPPAAEVRLNAREPVSTIWTIGHSTRPIEDFAELLRINGIEAVADVRRFPASRAYPQYNEANLREALAERGVAYLWLPSLGGRRRPVPDSVNDAWRNEAFRGYADHIATEEFAGGLFELVMVGQGIHTAIMCSEAVWWRCHRSLISDVLRSIGFTVKHIVDKSEPKEHPYSSPARVVDGQLTYSQAPEMIVPVDDLWSAAQSPEAATTETSS